MHHCTDLEVTHLINRSITSLHRLATLYTTITPYIYPSMPKIRDSGQKPDEFEVATTQTRRGKQITHVPVKDSTPLPSPSRNASPSKKRAWSPGAHEPDIAYDSGMDPTPKRSRTSGKVCINVQIIHCHLTTVFRHRTSFCESI